MDYFCPYSCSYRTSSGFCGSTGGYSSCQKRKENQRRIVYRGDVYNALEAERIKTLYGVLEDRYIDGFHDGLKRAIAILANDVKDVNNDI